MLNAAEIERIEENWSPPAWPEGPASDWAKAMHTPALHLFPRPACGIWDCREITWSTPAAARALGAFALAGAFERVTRLRLHKRESGGGELAEGPVRAVATRIRQGRYSLHSGRRWRCGRSVLLQRRVRLRASRGDLRRVFTACCAQVAWRIWNSTASATATICFAPRATKKIGADVVYNTYCQTALSAVIAAINPTGR